MTITVNHTQLAALARELQSRIPKLKYLHALKIIGEKFGYENEAALMKVAKETGPEAQPVAWLCEDKVFVGESHITQKPERAAYKAESPEDWQVTPLFGTPNPMRKTTGFHAGFNRVMAAALALPEDTQGKRALLSIISQERAAASPSD